MFFIVFFRVDKQQNSVVKVLRLPINLPTFTTLRKKAFENIVGKEENAGYRHFLLFPECFLPFPSQIRIFDSYSLCHYV